MRIIKLSGALAAVCICIFFAAGRAFSIQIQDDLGNMIALDQPARRIVPLYGAFAEMLFAVEAGEYVAGRTEADQFPEAIKRLPSIGTHMRPNVEMIIGLKPDLVIQSGSRMETAAELQSLKRAGIAVAVFAPKSFADIFSTITRLGLLTGREQQAKDLVAVLEARLAEVKLSLGFESSPAASDKFNSRRRNGCKVQKNTRVFFEVRSEPLTAAGRGSIVQEILTAAGAENVVSSPKALLVYSLEALLYDDPDVYIVQTGPMNRNPVNPPDRVHYNRLKAINQNKILYVNEFLYSRPGPRCVDAVEQLAKMLYPQCF
jgi:iron complex transport system substrate-binding protein